ncbi:MAG: hypothetical protein K2W82_09840 [Candidatus Obscuribacterales bacterium]|nr:hypothetical protein [Candidatus Obscuribacterales bacterium]
MSVNANYVKPKRIWLKDSPEFNELWVQNLIADDPSVLGLGDLVLRDRERVHKGSGRLDLLLQNIDTLRRYEVEIQLGKTDESHIIRTLDYWDIERKRYPQYDHCAVIVAEDISSRFLNVISLFNGSIPIIALQMQALRVGNSTTLVFTTVLNELTRGLVDEDEDTLAAPTDRSYWVSRSSDDMVSLADEIANMCKGFAPSISLKYNKVYIGFQRDTQPFNFATLVPKKNHVVLRLHVPKSDYFDSRIEADEFEALDYPKGYKISLSKTDVEEKKVALEGLLKLVYESREKC